MSTKGTETGPQATEETPLTDEGKQESVTMALAGLRNWANEHEISMELVLQTLKDGEGMTTQHDKAYPPFHRIVSWADILDPNGIKWHVVIREGAEEATILANLEAGSAAFEQLLEHHGWMTADRRAKATETPETQKATPAAAAPPKAKAKARGKADAEAAPDTTSAAATRTIQAESIFKGVTDPGGNEYYTVKGFPWKQYGVRCWPDSGKIGKLAGVVDLDAWEIGETIDFSDVDTQAVVRMKEGDKPDKVVDWIGDDVLDTDPGENADG